MKRGISDRESSAAGSDIMYPSVDVNPHSQRATDDEDRIRDEVGLEYALSRVYVGQTKTDHIKL